jgi:hypothetical protein
MSRPLRMRQPGQQGRTRTSTLSFRQREPDSCLAHYDEENDPGKTAAPGDGPTGMPAWTDDSGGSRAERYGYVNRVIADDELDEEVSRIASRLARLDHDAIARTKSYGDRVTLPADSELPPTIADLTGHGLGQPAPRRPARGPPP